MPRIVTQQRARRTVFSLAEKRNRRRDNDELAKCTCWIPCNGANTLTISKSLFLVAIVVVYEIEWYRMLLKSLYNDLEYFMLLNMT